MGDATRCLVCDKEFVKKRGPHIYCSKYCNSVAQNRKSSPRAAEGIKNCRTCKQDLPLADFDLRARSCRACAERRAAGQKRCPGCGEAKPLSEFHERRDRACRAAECKACSSSRSKTYNAQPENKERVRNRHYLYRYGISAERYDQMVAERGNRCDICGGPPNGKGALHVDHDHACCPGDRTCGKCVRGLLCYRCNTALGAINDNLQTAQGMLSYLRRHS